MPRDRSTAGEILLTRLRAHGVDYVFANGGTDFAPIIEALAQAEAEGRDLPRALVMPHETAAVAMAHGYYLATGRPQAVMVHTNVGLANVVMGVINAAAEQIPMLICSGRTPVTETGLAGSRTTPINWGQDMRDQTALLRESVKWDFELRYPEQTLDLVDRALAIAQSSPQGPVYLSLPREALCARAANLPEAGAAPRFSPATTAADSSAIDEAARLLAAARTPLIITHRSGGTAAGFEALGRLAEAFAIPVVEFWPSRNSLSTASPMHAGFDPGAELAEADVVLVLDALVPWIPLRHAIHPDCKVIQAGPDPLHQRFPIRGFRSDVSLSGEVTGVIRALTAALHALVQRDDTSIAARARQAGERNRTRSIERRASAARQPQGCSTVAWVSHCVSELLASEGIVVNEMGIDPACMQLTRAGMYLSHAVAGGLGWGLPTALGVQLADRSRLVVATIGDGAYVFANPTACHQIAEALELPVLTVVFNNGSWNTVRRSTLDIFPDGAAARARSMPVVSLEPSPDYCKTAEASRAWTQRVERAEALPAALRRAVEVIRNERRQALLDVTVPGPAGS